MAHPVHCTDPEMQDWRNSLHRGHGGFPKTTVARGLLSGGIAVIFLSGLLLAADLEKTAREAVDTKNFREARQLYIQLSEQDPASVDYQLWIGRLSAWLDDYAAATRSYDRVLAREPENADALVGKAYVLMWQQEFQAAHELLSQAQRKTPESTDVLLALARYHYYQGRNREALAQIESYAVPLSPPTRAYSLADR